MRLRPADAFLTADAFHTALVLQAVPTNDGTRPRVRTPGLGGTQNVVVSGSLAPAVRGPRLAPVSAHELLVDAAWTRLKRAAASRWSC
jgi:hypothetical protein